MRGTTASNHGISHFFSPQKRTSCGTAFASPRLYFSPYDVGIHDDGYGDSVDDGDCNGNVVHLRLLIFSDSTPFTDSLFLFFPAEYSVSRDVQSNAMMNTIKYITSHEKKYVYSRGDLHTIIFYIWVVGRKVNITFEISLIISQLFLLNRWHLI